MLEAIVLGLVQGLTEFLPVSSSGHGFGVPYLLSWPQPSLAFQVALHAGTLLAVVAYFYGDLFYLATRSIGIGVVETGEAARARRTIGLLALASVPAAIAGFLLEGLVEDTFSHPISVGVALWVTGGLLILAETIRERRATAVAEAEERELSPADLRADHGRDESTVGPKDALAMGVAQAFAIIPGISRAGSTMAAGMLGGLSRLGAARFSFLMSVPVILGANILKLPDLADDTSYSLGEIGVGVATAAISGYWAIRFLLDLIAKDDLRGFARYVFVFGALLMVGYLWLGPPSTI